MRRRSFVLGSAALAAQARAQRHGLHGMAVFGGHAGLYASHLPMFHAPHDVQLLLRIRLAQSDADAHLRAELARRPRLFTLAPERFDLDRLRQATQPELTQFQAQCFDGHFEREGKPWGEVQSVQVQALLLQRTLDPRPRRATQQQWWLLAQGHEAFVVKQLDQRPDVDAIGAVPLRQAVPAWRRRLSLPASGMTLPQPATLTRLMQAQGLQPAGALRWLYVEAGDLT